MEAMSTPTLTMSRGAFLSNIEQLQGALAPSELMVVMKDDAYGHGVEWMVDAATSDAATPVRFFGGYDVPTSLRIRVRAPQARVFAWATSDDADVTAALEAGIELGVGTADYLRRIIALAEAAGAQASLHLKIDTGLHRNGIRPEDWGEVVAETLAAERAGSVRLVGVWSHLAEASDAEDDEAARLFDEAVAAVRDAGGAPADLHLTASAASWWRPELRRSVSRIGAFSYGVRSADGPELPGLTLISRLQAPVIELHDDHIVIGLGGLHGFPSTLSGAPVGTPGGRRELLSIGAMTSRLHGWPGVAVGDVVTVFGPGSDGEVDATALAERIDTVGEEILTRLTSRVTREITD